MVDGVSQKDLNALSRYVYGLPEDPDTVMHSPSENFAVGAGSYSIWKGYKWTKNNWGNLSNLKTVEQGLKGNNILETIGNFNRNSKLNELSSMFKEVPNSAAATPAPAPAGGTATASTLKWYQNIGTKLKKYSGYDYLKQRSETARTAKELRNFTKSEYYNDVRRLVDEARGLKGAAYKAKLNEINKAILEANANVHTAKISGNLKPANLSGKIGAAVKKGTGINTVINKTDKLLSKSKGLQKAVKLSRGKGILTAIAIVPEAMNISKTYSKLGTSAGNKQLVKSSLVIGAELGGYAVGMKAGAALGAAIGSVIPGAGTIVGGILGAGVGLVGSYFAGKAMEQAVGKPELEIAADEAAESKARAASNDINELEQLLIETENTAGSDINNLPKNLKPAFVNAVKAYYETPNPEQSSKMTEKNTTNNTQTGKTTTQRSPQELSELLKKTKAKLLAYAEAMEKPLYGKQDDWSAPNTYSMPNQMMNMGMMFNPSMNFGSMMGSYMG